MTRVPRSLGLLDVVDEHARSYPGGLALVDGDVRLTWSELGDRARTLASALHARGVGPGDRVLWVGQNSFRLVETLLAASTLRAMVCPANWRWSARELAFALDDLDPALVLWPEAELGATVEAVRATSRAGATWVRHDAGPGDGYEALVEAGGGLPVPDGLDDPDLPALVVYTAAFDGKPNGALLSQANLLAQASVIGYLYDLDRTTTYLCAGPLFHIGAFMWLVAVLAHGGTNVVLPRMDAPAMCRAIEVERCTGGFFVPPTIVEIVEVARREGRDLSSLRVAQYAELWDGLVERIPTRAGRWPGGFGQTEVTGLAVWSAIGGPAEGRHGRPPATTQVRIHGPDDTEVPPGEAGELVVRGALVGHGYWNRPALNEARTRGGWWHSGDLGRREPDGSITFLGTMTRMIKSGVENIYPQEVEACLAEHPDVAEAAVIGVPEPRFVQAVKAVVALRPGAEADEAALVAHCRRHLAGYKKPRFVELVDRLPRTAAGAVDYDALDERFGGGNYPGGDTPITG